MRPDESLRARIADKLIEHQHDTDQYRDSRHAPARQNAQFIGKGAASRDQYTQGNDDRSDQKQNMDQFGNKPECKSSVCFFAQQHAPDQVSAKVVCTQAQHRVCSPPLRGAAQRVSVCAEGIRTHSRQTRARPKNSRLTQSFLKPPISSAKRLRLFFLNEATALSSIALRISPISLTGFP